MRGRDGETVGKARAGEAEPAMTFNAEAHRKVVLCETEEKFDCRVAPEHLTCYTGGRTTSCPCTETLVDLRYPLGVNVKRLEQEVPESYEADSEKTTNEDLICFWN